MLKKLFLVLALSVISANVFAQPSAKPVNVIFDTDMATDYDDVGAITILHYFADHGKASILATIASSKHPRVAAVLNVLNTYFKKPGIPIGVPTGEASDKPDWQKWSDTLVAKYPHNITSNDQVMDAVKLYRKILAKQPDNSVTIITVGFFTNIANLLKSGADEYSPLTGQQLVDKKVLKLVSMGGKYPSGSEFNINDDPASSIYVFMHWSKPVIFSGFEIGSQIHTGIPLIRNQEIINSPVRDAFRISIPQAKEDANGRMSWDETAVFVAVNGPEPYYKLTPGKIQIAEDGSNTWTTPGNHYYLEAIRPPSEMEKVINDLIMHQPNK
jgi:inosine-uridine nucleoside N-ribohydrolase